MKLPLNESAERTFASEGALPVGTRVLITHNPHDSKSVNCLGTVVDVLKRAGVHATELLVVR